MSAPFPPPLCSPGLTHSYLLPLPVPQESTKDREQKLAGTFYYRELNA